MKRLLILIMSIFIIGCEVPLELEVEVTPVIRWEYFCAECHLGCTDTTRVINCTSTVCHPVIKHPYYNRIMNLMNERIINGEY